MQYAVLGPGGVGGLLGAMLARAGHSVTLLVRPESLNHHPSRLTVDSVLLGDFEVNVELAATLNSPVDVVLIAVKAYDLDASLSAVSPRALGSGVVLPLLNGIDHIAKLRQVYGPERVIAGRAEMESERVAPGSIRHRQPLLRIGVAARPDWPSLAEAIVRELGEAGAEARLWDDEAVMLWGKLNVVAPLALTTAATGWTLGKVRDKPDWRERLASCIREVSETAKASGVAGLDLQLTMDWIMNKLPDGFRSSMQKDLERGRPIELDAIGKSVLRAADLNAVHVPQIEELVAMVEKRSTNLGSR
jgi:2-dehydropantoate 2-reductase